ncbi:MAG: hypothetical protein GMKNLPBB_00834 [Myxococcota bacterium]|nr:hypothetical protein [Myxococcota bacterium]
MLRAGLAAALFGMMAACEECRMEFDWFKPGVPAGAASDQEVEHRLPAAGLKQVLIENPWGDVRAGPAADGELVFRGVKIARPGPGEDKEKAFEAVTFEVLALGDEAAIKPVALRKDRLELLDRVDISAEIPASPALFIKARDGDVVLQRLEGAIEADQDEGDFEAVETGPLIARLGRVNLKLRDPGGAVSIEIRKGDALLEWRSNPAAPLRLRVREGSVRVLVPPDFSGRFELKSPQPVKQAVAGGSGPLVQIDAGGGVSVEKRGE